MATDTGIAPDAHAAIAGMVASRYIGKPTQRDLDVANVAYAAGAAAERERIRKGARDAAYKRRACAVPGSEDWRRHIAAAAALDDLADLLEGRTDGQ